MMKKDPANNNRNYDSSTNNESEENFVLKVETKSVTIKQELLQEITQYSLNAVPNEAIGLLGGKEIRPKELLATKAVFVTEGSENSVAFSDEDFKAFEKIADSNYCIGWWHSHPGYGLFLSQTDITTQIFSFQITHDFSVALVVDPHDIDTNGLAKYQFFQVVADSQQNFYQYKEVASFVQI